MAAPIVDKQIPALIEDQQTGQRYWLVGAGPSARVYHAAALTCQGASITLRAFEAGTEPPAPPAPRLVTTQAQPKPKPRLKAAQPQVFQDEAHARLACPRCLRLPCRCGVSRPPSLDDVLKTQQARRER